MPSDGDELAKTATATPGSASAPVGTREHLGDTLGRYRLERELGAGGMGVVHAAFDPDLERRVALKVLRGGGSEEARKRLLREARAMARLNHPNIITVHEVSSIAGRDYVAMELVDGESLAEWLRGGRRPQIQILDAFVAAGRGLAAAHAAGIVHRDFKPHNVLRSKTGRIVVTDFGLAREAGIDALEQTLPPDAAVASSNTPSTPLAGLTVTGSVLGTPAYMAPEQWTGGKVSPATDQFAFCVALWEALAGERPFRGTTAELLREQVTRGPAALDASKIPRYLRKTLMRGLDPDPAKRFPSMDALLRTMKRAERRPLVFLGLGVVGMMTIAIVFALAIRNKPVLVPPCPLPAQDPATVWSPEREQTIAGKQRAFEARQIGALFARWSAVRERVCAGDPAEGTARRACLDVVLARFDAVADAVESMPPGFTTEPAASLIDPEVCELPTVPRLVAPSAHVRDVIAAQLRDAWTADADQREITTAFVARVAADPCAAALARADLVAAGDEDERTQAAAVEDAERCGDDRIRADVALRGALGALETVALGDALDSKIKLAEVAIARVEQPDLAAFMQMLRAGRAFRAEAMDEALKVATSASQAFAARGMTLLQTYVELLILRMRFARGEPADVGKLRSDIAALRARIEPVIGKGHPQLDALDTLEATLAWSFGDIAGARKTFERVMRPRPNRPPRPISGKVVDEAGRPVAGARVIAGTSITADPLGIGWSAAPSQRETRTGPDGTFEIRDAVQSGIMIAELGERRSRPIPIDDRKTLALEPTSKLSGKVDLGGASAANVTVAVTEVQNAVVLFQVAAPVGADGTFELAGVPRGRVRIHVIFSGVGARGGKPVDLVVKDAVVSGVALALGQKGRRVDILVRSTVGAPVGNAQVRVYPGKVTSQKVSGILDRADFTSDALAQQLTDQVPAHVKAVARSGDLHALGAAPDGEASACAIGLPAKLSGDLQKQILKNLDKIELRCTPIVPGTDVVVVEVPPWPRLD